MKQIKDGNGDTEAPPGGFQVRFFEIIKVVALISACVPILAMASGGWSGLKKWVLQKPASTHSFEEKIFDFSRNSAVGFQLGRILETSYSDGRRIRFECEGSVDPCVLGGAPLKGQYVFASFAYPSQVDFVTTSSEVAQSGPDAETVESSTLSITMDTLSRSANVVAIRGLTNTQDARRAILISGAN